MNREVLKKYLPPPWVSIAIIGLGILWLLYKLKEMVVLLALSYLVAYLIDPIISFLERRRISRPVGILGVGGVSFILLLAVLIVIVPQALSEARELGNNIPRYIESLKAFFVPKTDAIIAYLSRRFGFDVNSELLPLLPNVGPAAFSRIGEAIISTLISGYSGAQTILNLLLLPLVVFYISSDFSKFHLMFINLFPATSQDQIVRIGGEINLVLRHFISGQLMVGGILSILYAFGLGIIGIDLWVLVALLSGFLQVVPYLGFAVGIFLASIMALVTFGDFWHLIQVWGVFAVVQALESFLITPKLVGSKVGLSPLLVILALFAGGQLFGLLGIFLAVPFSATFKVLWPHIRESMIER